MKSGFLPGVLTLFEFSAKNIQIWAVSLIMIALVGLSTVALFLLVETSPPVLFTLIVLLIASVFSTFTHLGLLLSTFVENRRVFQWKPLIIMLLVTGLIFSILLLFNIGFLAGTSIEMIFVFFIPTAFSLILHAVQIASLVKMKRWSA